MNAADRMEIVASEDMTNLEKIILAIVGIMANFEKIILTIVGILI